MIVRTAMCPSSPLLCAQVTGRADIAPELRAACARAVRWLLGPDAELIVVAGPAEQTGRWDPAGRLDPARFAPGSAGRDGTGTAKEPDVPALPLSLGLGAMLLDQAGYAGRRLLQAVGADEPADVCHDLGAALEQAETKGRRAGLLVMGDGSARRTPRAPGSLDPRAEGFDAAVEAAVRAGGLGPLAELDPDLSAELMVTGRPAWQLLAGALGDEPLAFTRIDYAAAPFGVGYLVARLART